MSWRRALPLASFAILIGVLPSFSGDKKDDKIPFEVYAKGYFVKNSVKLQENPAFLALPDKKAFDEIFGVGVVMGAKPKFVDEKLFENNMIVSVIKAGNAITTYQVEKVSRDKNKLIVHYKAGDKGPTTAQFRSPLILSVPRADVAEVVFMENGKDAGKVSVKK